MDAHYGGQHSPELETLRLLPAGCDGAAPTPSSDCASKELDGTQQGLLLTWIPRFQRRGHFLFGQAALTAGLWSGPHAGIAVQIGEQATKVG